MCTRKPTHNLKPDNMLVGAYFIPFNGVKVRGNHINTSIMDEGALVTTNLPLG